MNMRVTLSVGLLLLLMPMFLFGQGEPYEGPKDPAGDPAWEREGFMNGNRMRMLFNNNTQIADYPRPDASKWPDNFSGTKILDVQAVLIGAEVYVTQDSIPVTDTTQVKALAADGKIDTLIFIQTQDYSNRGSHMLDYNWNETVEWALAPVPGYLNPTQDFPAMSNKPNSWPLDGWPSAGERKKWQGEWNGRFGRGIHYADLESFFVANDAQDLEKIIDLDTQADQEPIDQGPRYYPRPGMQIGDLYPNNTTQVGFPWGGLGLRVQVRGYQWNNPEAQDIIFWEYNIANVSDYDLPVVGFGYFIDPSIGGDTGGDSETAFYDELLNLVYLWERTGKGPAGLTPGVFGVAYLESPGNAHDNVDNDRDGLLDERRDQETPGQIIGPMEGIHNLENFLNFYDYSEDELREHWSSDEDQDWENGNDVNGNGTYAYYDEEDDVWKLEPGESAGDDVGLDGVGPGDLNYRGPDEGEGNGQPDYVLGVGSEPNYNATDVNEADQIGLTSMHLLEIDEWRPDYQLQYDEHVWSLLDSTRFDEFLPAGNAFVFFGSATFPFYQGTDNRISTAQIAAYDDLTGLNAAEHSAPTMFRKKGNAQVIYERDYRFAQPPLMPTLTAIPGDGKVTLIWDDVADQRTREPLLNRENDFQGYKLYRSTDKFFQDPEIITNAHGVQRFKKPLFQCDKIDSIQGYAEHGIREGMAYYLGDNSGITHHYVDEDVLNGKTYYYALVAYDRGIPEFDISPTENTITVELDESENIIRQGKNVEVVSPRTPAAGYVPPQITVDEERSTKYLASGAVLPEVVNSNNLEPNHTYRVTFGVDAVNNYRDPTGPFHHPMDMDLVTSSIFVYDETSEDELVYSETPDNYALDHIDHIQSTWEQEEGEEGEEFDYYRFTDQPTHTDVFDGLRLRLDFADTDTAVLDSSQTGWVTGNAAMTVTYGSTTSYFPWDYDIIWTDTVSTPSVDILAASIRDVNNGFLSRGRVLTSLEFNFFVRNTNSVDSTTGQYERLQMVGYDDNGNGTYDWQEDRIFVGHTVESGSRIVWGGTVFELSFANVSGEAQLPQTGDVYRIRFRRPPNPYDSYVFKVNPGENMDQVDLNTTMDSIRVVPNPYIATNVMEPSVANQYLNQDRRLMFTHVPAQGVIRIFTPTGVLVDQFEINNAEDNGVAHWDLLTKEGLAVAAGMYVYQVESTVTGKQKVGKFAIIK